MNFKHHSFHIPVMGIGYTIDTPVKVAHLGIDSVISLVDDGLIEKMRYHYCRTLNKFYQPISMKVADYRAKRITAYLNLVNEMVDQKFEDLKSQKFEKGSDLYRYVKLLPEDSAIKQLIAQMGEHRINSDENILEHIKPFLKKGSIDVNIMSKGDTVRYKNSKEKLPPEFNDAHAAVRGFMQSDLKNSSLIISAGLNPKLFTYISTFQQVLPNSFGVFDKKITIKVSDYRSALVQGKFLAQRGVLVSEFRVESGLNCGGHAFATKGFLLGPILKEFADKREELNHELKTIYLKALADKNIPTPKFLPDILITAQGGVGTNTEHRFLQSHYNLHSVGWGSLFLLADDVVTIDKATLDLVANADENEIYLSDTSPFGIPFYSVRGNTKDKEKIKRIESNLPGSTCPKRFVALNNEFGDKALCTASKEYQKLKIEKIKNEVSDKIESEKQIKKVVNRTCICVGLGTSALIVNKLERRLEGETTSICPGPNLAYFSKKSNLIETVDHIYGRTNLPIDMSRPHMFIKEINLYLNYYKNFHLEAKQDEKQISTNHEFLTNLLSGINYYKDIFKVLEGYTIQQREKMLQKIVELETETLQLIPKSEGVHAGVV